MALANYTDLTTAVTDWMARSDLSGKAADFITLAESEIRRKFRGKTFEADTTLTGVTDSRVLGTSEGFPADYENPIALFLTTWGDHETLTPLQDGTFPHSAYVGVPDAWSITGDGAGGYQIELDRLCDQAHTFRFLYRQRMDIATNTTNWLLTNHPDVYLYGALKQAAIYTHRGNLTQSTRFDALFIQAVEDVQWDESKQNDALAVVDPMLVGFHQWNINSGYY